MSLGGGYDRQWLEPLSSEGRLTGDGTESYDDRLGCHQGFSKGLNIDNPQPGYDYLWARKDSRDINYYRRRGYQLVQSGDPEYAAFHDEYTESRAASPLDSLNEYQDVVLLRIPLEKLRVIREEDDRKARGLLRRRSDLFLERVSDAERAFDPRGRGTRFSMSNHRYDVRDARSDEVLDMWTPDQGIMER